MRSVARPRGGGSFHESFDCDYFGVDLEATQQKLRIHDVVGGGVVIARKSPPHRKAVVVARLTRASLTFEDENHLQ